MCEMCKTRVQRAVPLHERVTAEAASSIKSANLLLMEVACHCSTLPAVFFFFNNALHSPFSHSFGRVSHQYFAAPSQLNQVRTKQNLTELLHKIYSSVQQYYEPDLLIDIEYDLMTNCHQQNLLINSWNKLV